jgi:glycosyltransferase involved in cell wall biosynthesis
MRILIVSQYFWPETFRVNDLARGLTSRGHEVSVLTGIPNYPGGSIFPGYGLFGPLRQAVEGAAVVRVPLVPRGPAGRLRLALNYASFALLATLLAPFRLRGKFDAIVVFEPSPITVALPAIFLSRLRKSPVLLWVQDLWPDSISATEAVRSRWIIRRLESLVRFIYDNSDEILAQSMAFVPRIRELAADDAVIRYFPNWAESEYRPVDPSPAAARELPPGFRIVFAGNIGVAQSFDTILAAAERLRAFPEIQWLVFGDGRRRDAIEREIRDRSLSNSVRLLGRKPVEAMPEYFALADALLVTLRRDPVFSLTIPSKIQSYLACGRPILAALDGEGARIVSASGAGLVSRAEDPEGLAEAAMQLYRMSPDERDRMGRRGLEYSRANFDRDTLLDQLEQWIRDRAGC